MGLGTSVVVYATENLFQISNFAPKPSIPAPIRPDSPTVLRVRLANQNELSLEMHRFWHQKRDLEQALTYGFRFLLCQKSLHLKLWSAVSSNADFFCIASSFSLMTALEVELS